MSAIDKSRCSRFFAPSKLDIDNVPDVSAISSENFAAQQISYEDRSFL